MRGKKLLAAFLLGVGLTIVLVLLATKLDTEKILAYASLIGSLAAFGAALGAFLATKETRKASLAQIIQQMRNFYSSPEMLSGIMDLLDWKEQHGDNFAKTFGEKRENNYREVKLIDEDRRRFSHYFGTIQILLDLGLINRKIANKLRPPVQQAFFSKVIKALNEKVKIKETL